MCINGNISFHRLVDEIEYVKAVKVIAKFVILTSNELRWGLGRSRFFLKIFLIQLLNNSKKQLSLHPPNSEVRSRTADYRE